MHQLDSPTGDFLLESRIAPVKPLDSILINNGVLLFAIMVSGYYFYISGFNDLLLCNTMKKLIRIAIAFFSIFISLPLFISSDDPQAIFVSSLSIIPISIALITIIEPSAKISIAPVRNKDFVQLDDKANQLASCAELRKYRHEQRRKLIEAGEPLLKILSEKSENYKMDGFSNPIGYELVPLDSYAPENSFQLSNTQLLTSISLFLEIILFVPDASPLAAIINPFFYVDCSEPTCSQDFLTNRNNVNMSSFKNERTSSTETKNRQNDHSNHKEFLSLDKIITPTSYIPVSPQRSIVNNESFSNSNSSHSLSNLDSSSTGNASLVSVDSFNNTATVSSDLFNNNTDRGLNNTKNISGLSNSANDRAQSKLNDTEKKVNIPRSLNDSNSSNLSDLSNSSIEIPNFNRSSSFSSDNLTINEKSDGENRGDDILLNGNDTHSGDIDFQRNFSSDIYSTVNKKLSKQNLQLSNANLSDFKNSHTQKDFPEKYGFTNRNLNSKNDSPTFSKHNPIDNEAGIENITLSDNELDGDSSGLMNSTELALNHRPEMYNFLHDLSSPLFSFDFQEETLFGKFKKSQPRLLSMCKRFIKNENITGEDMEFLSDLLGSIINPFMRISSNKGTVSKPFATNSSTLSSKNKDFSVIKPSDWSLPPTLMTEQLGPILSLESQKSFFANESQRPIPCNKYQNSILLKEPHNFSNTESQKLSLVDKIDNPTIDRKEHLNSKFSTLSPRKLHRKYKKPKREPTVLKN